MASMFAEIAANVRESHDAFFATPTGVSVLLPGSDTPANQQAVLYAAKAVSRVEGNGATVRLVVREARFPDLQDIPANAVVYVTNGDTTETWAIEDVTDRSASGVTVQLVRIAIQHASRNEYRQRPSGQLLGTR